MSQRMPTLLQTMYRFSGHAHTSARTATGIVHHLNEIVGGGVGEECRRDRWK